jgi:hypothetical protein
MAKKNLNSILRDVSQVNGAAGPVAAAPDNGSAIIPPPPPAPPKLLDPLRIEEVTLLKLTRAMEKERAARMELQVTSSALNGLFHEWLRTDPRAQEVNGKIVALQAEQRAAEKTYHELVGQIGSELKIDMSLYAFDDDTGVLSKLPEPPQPEHAHPHPAPAQ